MAYEKKYYDRNKIAYKQRSANNRKKIREHLWKIKEASGCKYCNESHPAALQFHHRDPDSKSIDLGMVVNQGWGMQRIDAEIAKCDIICANCHLKLHWQERTN